MLFLSRAFIDPGFMERKKGLIRSLRCEILFFWIYFLLRYYPCFKRQSIEGFLFFTGGYCRDFYVGFGECGFGRLRGEEISFCLVVVFVVVF